MVRLVQQTMWTPDANDDDAVSAGSDDTREQGDQFESANKKADSPNCQEECEDELLLLSGEMLAIWSLLRPSLRSPLSFVSLMVVGHSLGQIVSGRVGFMHVGGRHMYSMCIILGAWSSRYGTEFQSILLGARLFSSFP